MWEAYLIDKAFFQARTFFCNFKLSRNALLSGRLYVVYQISEHNQ